MSLGRVTQPRWSTNWMGARLPSWAMQLRTSMSNLLSSSLIAKTIVMVWPILTNPETSEAQGPLPTWICIQQPTLSPAKSARTTSNISTGNGRKVTDFSYWSCHVQRSLRAWSQTSCTCGSNWTIIVFSKNVPEPACYKKNNRDVSLMLSWEISRLIHYVEFNDTSENGLQDGR